MFWTGLFTTQTKALAQKPVGEIMSDPPPSVHVDANLMELANLIYTKGARRLIVLKNGRIAGVVREQEIFFEMASIIQR
jgi:CBS domain-containing protein